MAVSIWTSDYDGAKITSDNPIVVKGVNAGITVQKQLWLRHDVLSGHNAESSYGIVIDPIDIFNSDESTWLQIAPDISGSPGTYGATSAAVALGDVNLGTLKPFWLKTIFPVNTDSGTKTDVYLKLTCSSSTQTRSVDLSAGTYNNCSYNNVLKSIQFNSELYDTGYYQTDWLDFTNYDAIKSSHILKTTWGFINTSTYYRTSAVSNDSGATSWYGNPSSLDTTKPWVQLRIYFYTILQPGLLQYIYNDLNFASLDKTTKSVVPVGNLNINHPASVKWIGYLNIVSAGTYGFRTVSRDGHRVYIDGILKAESFIGGIIQTNFSLSLGTGFHTIEYHSYQDATNGNLTAYITPPAQTERGLTKDDLFWRPSISSINELDIKYSGQSIQLFNINLYPGPDSIEIIGPEDDVDTEFFQPTLIAMPHNATHVQWQLDSVNRFNGTALSDWTTIAINDQWNESKSPVDRPSGIYYWRARSVNSGINGPWSDPRVINILPVANRSQFLYIYSNVGA